MTPRADLAGCLTRYPWEAGLGEEDPATVLDRCHTPDYEVVNDGVRLDRQRLLDHVRPARKRVAGVRVEVEQALVDGDQVAARYRLVAEMRKGGTCAGWPWWAVAFRKGSCRLSSLTASANESSF